MGWLKEHGATKVINLRGPSESPFHCVPDDWLPTELLDTEEAEWTEFKKQQAKKKMALMAQAMNELQARGEQAGMAKRGRPASLNSYKEYKRQFLSKWTTFLEASAKRHGVNQEDLAATLELGGGRQWRMMKGGTQGAAGGCYRVTDRFFNQVILRISRQRGWHRRTPITFLLPHLMSHEEFKSLVIATELEQA